MDVSCFDNIIGLSRTPCYDLSADITTSDSGLYMDELIPLSKIESILNCKVGENAFDFMEKARSNAIIDFRIDASARLSERAEIKRRPFIGRIGKVKRDKVLTPTAGRYYGMVLRCDDIVGGELKITNIGTIFDTTGTIILTIKNNLNELISSTLLQTTAGTLKENIVSETLPMHSDYVENLEYYFVYEYSDNTPYNNKLYDTQSSKSYATQTNKQFGYSDYLFASGVGLSGIDDLSDVSIVSDSRCFGITMAVEARCKVDDIWCYGEMDYVGDAIDMAVAKAVRLKAVYNLIMDIALSENLNRDTMIDGQKLGEIGDAWMVEYTDMIDYIVKNMDITKTDCFECGKEVLMGVGNIKS